MMKIISIAISKKKGTRKQVVNEALFIPERGIKGDAHAGAWHRQVSFLAGESIEKARQKGYDVTFGDFAENVATSGVDWERVKVGTEVQLGNSVRVEVSQIGKECHKKCAIFYKAGDCIMPREGIFARVIKGGAVRVGDAVSILETKPT